MSAVVLVQTGQAPVCDASVWVPKSFAHHLEVPQPSWHVHFFLTGPELWGKEFDRDALFRAKCFKIFLEYVFSLYNVWLCVSIFVPVYCRKKLFWWWLNKLLIYEYSIISLRVILWLPFFFFFFLFLRPVLLSFILGPWAIWSQILNLPGSVRYEFHLVDWALNKISFWLIISSRFVPLLSWPILEVVHHCR